MWSRNFFGFSERNSAIIWRTCFALALSVLIHLLVLGGLNVRLPLLDPHESVVQVQLAPPVTVAEEVLQLPTKRNHEPVETVLSEEAVPEPPAEEVPGVPDVTEQAQPEPLIPSQPDSQPELAIPADSESPVIAEAAKKLSEDVPEHVQEPVQQEQAQQELKDAEPTSAGLITDKEAYIETDFELRQDGKVVGISHISFKQNLNGTYSLTSTTEAKGLISLFLRGQLIQTSQGLLTRQGLKPTEFRYEMTSKEEKSRLAQFEWQSGELLLQTDKGAKTVTLPEGAQDLLSFMYQFVFVPPMENMKIPITNGKKLDVYAYAFEGEEEFMTAIGNLRTFHISHHGEDGEKTDLWLAVDYLYMPIKIRKTEKDGRVIEQNVTRLSTDFPIDSSLGEPAT